MEGIGDNEISLWDETDCFFYDALHFPDGHHCPIKVRSMVGLVPLFAVGTLEPEILNFGAISVFFKYYDGQ